MAAAWANIASMKEGGSSSWSIEWAPMGLTAAPAGGAMAPASAAQSVRTATASANV
jgi:hypothetical protein